jgi:hypothetical protein
MRNEQQQLRKTYFYTIVVAPTSNEPTPFNMRGITINIKPAAAGNL